MFFLIEDESHPYLGLIWWRNPSHWTVCKPMSRRRLRGGLYYYCIDIRHRMLKQFFLLNWVAAVVMLRPSSSNTYQKYSATLHLHVFLCPSKNKCSNRQLTTSGVAPKISLRRDCIMALTLVQLPCVDLHDTPVTSHRNIFFRIHLRWRAKVSAASFTPEPRHHEAFHGFFIQFRERSEDRISLSSSFCTSST